MKHIEVTEFHMKLVAQRLCGAASTHLDVLLFIYVAHLSNTPGHSKICNLAHLVVVYQDIPCRQVSMDDLRSYIVISILLACN
jgi:hypothetical protein